MTGGVHGQSADSGRLPIAYFTFAYLCLISAFVLLALEPGLLAGFYHPRLIGVVHLVTLGWITGSVLGALHIVCPLALSVPLAAGRLDRWVLFPVYVLGVLGLVSHFWIFEFSGMAWSGVMAAAVLARYGWRVLSVLGKARLPRAVAWSIRLAFLNLGGAVTLGLDLAFQRALGDLSPRIFQQVAAHAHLAAVGFVILLATGLGWRLIPMILPSRVPPAVFPRVTVVSLEAGLLLLALSLLLDWGASFPATVLIAGGLASFVASVAWMFSHRLRAPAARPAGDPAAAVVITAVGLLAAAVAMGLLLSRTDWPPPGALVIAYGLAALPGFLGLLIVAVQMRLVPMYVWVIAAARSPGPPSWSAHDRIDPFVARVSWIAWLTGLVVLAAGAAAGSQPLTAFGATTAAAGQVAGLWHLHLLACAPPLKNSANGSRV